jgi:hypothetical protein
MGNIRFSARAGAQQSFIVEACDGEQLIGAVADRAPVATLNATVRGTVMKFGGSGKRFFRRSLRIEKQKTEKENMLRVRCCAFGNAEFGSVGLRQHHLQRHSHWGATIAYKHQRRRAVPSAESRSALAC